LCPCTTLILPPLLLFYVSLSPLILPHYAGAEVYPTPPSDPPCLPARWILHFVATGRLFVFLFSPREQAQFPVLFFLSHDHWDALVFFAWCLRKFNCTLVFAGRLSPPPPVFSCPLTRKVVVDFSWFQAVAYFFFVQQPFSCPLFVAWVSPLFVSRYFSLTKFFLPFQPLWVSPAGFYPLQVPQLR